MSRYLDRLKGVNRNKMYQKTFEDRQVEEIKQYRTPVVSYPKDEELKRIEYVVHTWHYGDMFYKLADKHIMNKHGVLSQSNNNHKLNKKLSAKAKELLKLTSPFSYQSKS